jgi:formamidopyrimidine-DNA glycosylase
MPELPEVETTRRGIEPLLVGQRIRALVVRNRRLRWPIPRKLGQQLPGQCIQAVTRRAKYLLLTLERGTLIIHLGMSGSLRVVAAVTAPDKFDHVDMLLENGDCLRLRDPRRFGALLWTARDPAQHKLLKHIGLEPFDPVCDGDYLYLAARKRTVAIRDLLLNGRVVAGIGNIYANEALFAAGIRPNRAAGRVSRARCARLIAAVRATLTQAIAGGGTTLRDFQQADGNPGYFRQKLTVYGRVGQPCPRCRRPIRAARLGQRRAFYCPHCQN